MAANPIASPRKIAKPWCRWVCLVGFLVAPIVGIDIANITKCQDGAADLVNNSKVFTVQVCNLFGNTCYVNQVETPTADCATKALKLENQKCALFPIMSYDDNDRSNETKLQVGGLGCYGNCMGTDCVFSGGCVSVQCMACGCRANAADCAIASCAFVGVATTKTGSRLARTDRITNTSVANTFFPHEFAAIPYDAAQTKTVFLTRTGNYVATARQGGAASSVPFTYGDLPTVEGDNYGPKPCPCPTMRSSAATETKEELRMCGVTDKKVNYNGMNLLMDKTMYVQASGDSLAGVSTERNFELGTAAYLFGASNYRSGNSMDDSRMVYLLDGKTNTSDVLMTSEAITPKKSAGMATPVPNIAGTWRSYTVVYYCDEYDRTDLTKCPVANRKTFYVGDPNPAAQFGTTAGGIGVGGSDVVAFLNGSLPASIGVLRILGALIAITQA